MVLNSKDKAPYLLYVEVLEVEDSQTCPIPAKISSTAATCVRQTRSEENLLERYPPHRHNLSDSTGDGGSSSNSAAPTPPPQQRGWFDCSQLPCGSRTLFIFKLSFGGKVDVGSAAAPNAAFQLYDDLSDAWSQEDDEITSQFLQMHSSLKVFLNSFSVVNLQIKLCNMHYDSF